jgi:RimJ/RimL family protein N-acetyltransferase
MIPADYFRDQVTLRTPNLRLEPLGPEHFEGAWAVVNDYESRRLSGTHVVYDESSLLAHLEERRAAADRADWAIIRESDGAYIGEVNLADLHPHNETMSYRIALGGQKLFGKGYGSEATKAVVDYALQTVGLHRITLIVVDYNTRAQRVYEKAGFHQEALLREAWFWDGEWSDVVLMAVLAH